MNVHKSMDVKVEMGTGMKMAMNTYGIFILGIGLIEHFGHKGIKCVRHDDMDIVLGYK